MDLAASCQKFAQISALVYSLTRGALYSESTLEKKKNLCHPLHRRKGCQGAPCCEETKKKSQPSSNPRTSPTPHHHREDFPGAKHMGNTHTHTHTHAGDGGSRHIRACLSFLSHTHTTHPRHTHTHTHTHTTLHMLLETPCPFSLPTTESRQQQRNKKKIPETSGLFSLTHEGITAIKA